MYPFLSASSKTAPFQVWARNSATDNSIVNGLRAGRLIKAMRVSKAILFILFWSTSFTGLGQDCDNFLNGNPTNCCQDATCTWCFEVACCEEAPFSTPQSASSGGEENCGIEIGVPCTTWTENNSIGGVCLPSCNNPAACNYDADAPNDADCTFPGDCEDCQGVCLEDVNNNDICDCVEVAGCTDAEACNYDVDANLEDGSCAYADTGFNCDGTCIDDDGDGVCLLDEVHGCTDPLAINYYAIFTEDDGGCLYPSDFETEVGVNDCPSDVDNDGYTTVSDVLAVLSSFGFECPE